MTPDPEQPEVLSSLPHTRPTRRSAKRDGGTAGKGKPAAKPKEAAKPKARAAKAKAPAARAAAQGAKAARPGAARAKKRGPAQETVPPNGWATPHDDRPPSGGELVTTGVRAIGELAQIGLTFGAQALRQALRRGPRS